MNDESVCPSQPIHSIGSSHAIIDAHGARCHTTPMPHSLHIAMGIVKDERNHESVKHDVQDIEGIGMDLSLFLGV